MSTAAVSSKGSFQPDNDVHITYGDQQKINKFARQNAKLNDLKAELKNKERELQNLEDAGDELLMVDDESALIPYMMGEVFILQNLEDTQRMIEEAKQNSTKEKESLVAQCGTIKQIMIDLKVALYAKFGNNINLESDD